MIEQTKFTYSPLGKALEKQTNAIEDQGEKQIKAIEEHGKQLIQSNALVKNDYDSENNYRLHLNHKKICHELVDVRKNETNTLREKLIIMI